MIKMLLTCESDSKKSPLVSSPLIYFIFELARFMEDSKQLETINIFKYSEAKITHYHFLE